MLLILHITLLIPVTTTIIIIIIIITMSWEPTMMNEWHDSLVLLTLHLLVWPCTPKCVVETKQPSERGKR